MPPNPHGIVCSGVSSTLSAGANTSTSKWNVSALCADYLLRSVFLQKVLTFSRSLLSVPRLSERVAGVGTRAG